MVPSLRNLTLLSVTVTTHYEFVFTGDFSSHVGNPDPLASQLVCSLSSINLMQYVSFPTHKYNHLLDMVLTLCGVGRLSLANSFPHPVLDYHLYVDVA